MNTNHFVPPLLERNITKTNDGVPLGLLNWMIHNRLTTNAPIVSQDCRIGTDIIRPYWLNIMIGNNRTQCADYVRPMCN